MACSGRIYKGGPGTISVPFSAEDYSGVSVTFFTDGVYSIVKGEDELVIEDGYIYCTFAPTDLDILADGVLRYTIEYTSDGVSETISSTTPYYLRNAPSYTATSVQDIYNSGYTAGFEDCEECDCSELEAIAFNSGYTAGLNDCGCSMETEKSVSLSFSPGDVPSGSISITPDEGYAGMAQVNLNYQAALDFGYGEGFSAGVVNQKAKLSAVTLTSNSTYTRADGWSAVTVAVPAVRYNKVIISGTFITSADFRYTDGPYNLGMYTLPEYPSWFKNVALVDGDSVLNIDSSVIDPGYYDILAGTHTFVADLTNYRWDAQPLDYQWVGFENETSHNIKVFVIPQ